MAPLSHESALTGALGILRDLADSRPCDLSEHGQCEVHGWRLGHEPCPQLRLRMLLKETEKRPPIPPYTQLALLALLRGATDKQEVHVRVRFNGHIHRGVLGWTEGTATGLAAPFYVDLLHGERVEQLSADDVLEADVCGRSLLGVPIDPTHDPK